LLKLLIETTDLLGMINLEYPISIRNTCVCVSSIEITVVRLVPTTERDYTSVFPTTLKENRVDISN
jgi:hypothetical protein